MKNRSANNKLCFYLVVVIFLLLQNIGISFGQNQFLGDYGNPLRETTYRSKSDTFYHINTPELIKRLISANVTNYMFLMSYKNKWELTDWQDFVQEFMPAAQKAGLKTWVYLVPPSEKGPTYPYNLSNINTGYIRWAEAIAREANKYSNLVGFVMDDFGDNVKFPFNPKYEFTPAFIKEMMDSAHIINAKLKFYVINYAYYNSSEWVDNFADVIDGLIFPYRNLKNTDDLLYQITETKSTINGSPRTYYKFSLPAKTVTNDGEFASINLKVKVNKNALKCSISFWQNDNIAGDPANFHIKRLLVDDKIVWSEDVHNVNYFYPDTAKIKIDLTDLLKNKTTANISFQLYEEKKVYNYPVTFLVDRVDLENLILKQETEVPSEHISASIYRTKYSKNLPLIVMIYASEAIHQGRPSPFFVEKALKISHDAVLDGFADGIVTYALNKRDTSAYLNIDKKTPTHFGVVKRLYIESNRQRKVDQ